MSADLHKAELFNWACPEVPAVAPQRRTEHSLCAAVTQRSGGELRLKAVEQRGLSADTNINSGPLQRPRLQGQMGLSLLHWKGSNKQLLSLDFF